MPFSKDAIQRLARKYIDGTATEAEINELFAWYDEVNAGDTESILVTGDEAEFSAATWEGIQAQLALKKSLEPRRSRWWATAAAVAVLLLAGGLTAIYLNGNRQAKTMATVTKRVSDIPAPSAARAVLTLANGKQILLDSAGNGLLASQADANIVKNDSGQIVYMAGGHDQQTQYNTLSIPAGSRAMAVVLADGSKVWLNAASSLTYPTSFSGKQRRVIIKGEGYFEVASNAAAPFVVARPDKGLEVQVLGTHFDVNTYDDEPDIRVTLVSGAVRVSGGASQQPVVISPGQQARITPSSTVVKQVDAADVTAWKEGLFVFDATDIQMMMRQAARWYNVTVKYPHGVPQEQFTGSISTDASLSEFLKILDYSGVTATINDKTILINP
ncbi:FecR family protein [Chitinophaga sp. 22321]|uniref:FecR domain-containing protein n=1 Tax=Chitinophaga hostae TaxID=2831022 RepID=A0ABS5J499_9BACT|nr:FecR family protein [Chitinophaga hostae]MBS0029970.1 FecR domain-containing protein [Chitinophaga hostae]